MGSNILIYTLLMAEIAMEIRMELYLHKTQTLCEICAKESFSSNLEKFRVDRPTTYIVRDTSGIHLPGIKSVAQ